MTTPAIHLLADELQAFETAFRNRIGAETVAIMDAAEEELIRGGAGTRALRAGAAAPDVTLPDQDGTPRSLTTLLRQGPTVVVFYRGGWCPYCNMTLRAYQRRLPDILAVGGQLVAISPQTPDHSLETAEKNALGFPVLSDVGSVAADRFGIAFPLPEPLRPLYTRFGHGLPAINGTTDWRLPIPATFVIGRDGRIVLSHVDTHYQNRLEPDAAIAALR